MGASPVLTLGHCGGALGSDHFLNQGPAQVKQHNLGRLRPPKLPAWMGCPPPQGGGGNSWILFPGMAGRTDSQPSQPSGNDGSQGARFVFI